MASAPQQGLRAHPLAHLAGQDDEHAGEAEQGGEDRAALDPLLQEERGEIERDQGRDEGQGDALRQRHPGQPPEEEEAHHRGHHAADEMDAHRRARRPRRPRDPGRRGRR